MFEERVSDAPALSDRVARTRLADHRAFVARRREAGIGFEYESENYDFPVTTRQERSLRFYAVDDVDAADGAYRATHEPVGSGDLGTK